MPRIFIDESGQFSKNKGEKYFVIASFKTIDYRKTEKKLKNWYRNKFPKKMRWQTEIKFSDTNIDSNLKKKTIKFISGLNIEIYYCYFLRKNIPITYWCKDKLQSGMLYTNIVGEVLEMHLPTDDLEFRVFCDQRHLKGVKHPQFKSILKTRLTPKLSQKSIIQVEMIDSVNNLNIQLVDWIVGSIAAYLENKKDGDIYYEMLKKSIIKEIELFNH